MNAMKAGWKTENNRLIHRWVETQETRVRYNSPWIQDASHTQDVTPLAAAPNFSSLSPFGGRDWYGYP